MPRPKNPQKRKPPNTLERSPLHAIHCIRDQLLSPKFLLPIKDNSVRDIVVPNPVTDPVRVAGPEEDLQAGLDQRGEGWKEGFCICYHSY